MPRVLYKKRIIEADGGISLAGEEDVLISPSKHISSIIEEDDEEKEDLFQSSIPENATDSQVNMSNYEAGESLTQQSSSLFYADAVYHQLLDHEEEEEENKKDGKEAEAERPSNSSSSTSNSSSNSNLWRNGISGEETMISRNLEDIFTNENRSDDDAEKEEDFDNVGSINNGMKGQKQKLRHKRHSASGGWSKKK